MSATPAALAPDLVAGLKRVQLAHFRVVAAEIVQTATTQRWPPEQLLRTLLSTEIAGRDAANQAARLKAAGFPVAKTFDGFQVAVSSVPQATLDYVASLEWLRARENLCLIGPVGTGKTHLLLAAGQAAVLAGHKVKYLIAADLVETLYRGLADNQWGRFLPQQSTAASLLDRLLHHAVIVVTDGESFRMKEARSRAPARRSATPTSQEGTYGPRA